MPRISRYNYDYLADNCLAAWERDKPTHVAVDTETSGFNWTDRPFCATVAWMIGSYPYPERIEAHYLELNGGFPEQVVKTILDHSPDLVFHNAKFDLRMLIEYGLLERDELDPLTLHDTQKLAYLLDEHRRKGLKPLARLLLGESTNEDEVLKEARKEVKKRLGLKSVKEVSYDMIPRRYVLPYAIKDAEFTIRLFHKLYPEVRGMGRPTRDIPSLHDLYLDEQELTLVLLDMETAGMGVDVPYVERTAKEYAKKALLTELDIRDMVGREDFNPNSPKQLTKAFAKRGIDLDSTNKQTLSELDDPLAEKVLDLRSTKKMHGTYLTSMLEETVDGVLHPNFNDAKTKTGRFSSSSAGR